MLTQMLSSYECATKLLQIRRTARVCKPSVVVRWSGDAVERVMR